MSAGTPLNPYPCPRCQARGCDACKQTGRECFPHPEIDAYLRAEGITDRKPPLMDREAWERSHAEEPMAEIVDTRKRRVP